MNLQNMNLSPHFREWCCYKKHSSETRARMVQVLAKNLPKNNAIKILQEIRPEKYHPLPPTNGIIALDTC